jgi:hypothetical protein
MAIMERFEILSVLHARRRFTNAKDIFVLAAFSRLFSARLFGGPARSST